ncbi:MAG: hypothetical protein M5U19_10795 [Microthrixaceae bacterium]|nr:hypothetical protein [Microthrixaceae bacterium]
METATSPMDRLRDPLADPPWDRRRLRLAALMVVMGALHFVVPGPFRRIVPRWFPWRSEAVAVSGAAELAAGILMAFPAQGASVVRSQWWSSLRCSLRTCRWPWTPPPEGLR